MASRMFSIGKNLLLLDKVYTPDEVLKALDSVTLDDIEEAKKLICDIDSYSAIAVTDKRINLKAMMEG